MCISVRIMVIFSLAGCGYAMWCLLNGYDRAQENLTIGVVFICATAFVCFLLAAATTTGREVSRLFVLNSQLAMICLRLRSALNSAVIDPANSRRAVHSAAGREFSHLIVST